jgi:hypothetical protein
MYTRKAFIEDTVKIFIEGNPDKWIAFQELVKQRRAKTSDKFGRLIKENGLVDNDDIRIAVTLPTEVNNALETVLSSDTNGSFPMDKKELHWFMRKFPQFVIPKEI